MSSKTVNGKPVACAGSKSIKRLISDHLADKHGIWLTTREFRCETIHSVAALDPCRKVLVA